MDADELEVGLAAAGRAGGEHRVDQVAVGGVVAAAEGVEPAGHLELDRAGEQPGAGRGAADAAPAKSCQGVLPPERRWSTHAQPRSAPSPRSRPSDGRSPVTQLLGPPPGAGPELLAGSGRLAASLVITASASTAARASALLDGLVGVAPAQVGVDPGPQVLEVAVHDRRRRP